MSRSTKTFKVDLAQLSLHLTVPVWLQHQPTGLYYDETLQTKIAQLIVILLTHQPS